MRLFLGIDLPPHLKQHIREYLLPIQLSPKGWEQPHDYHQTLLFIGEASDKEMSDIKHRMDRITFHPFELETLGFKFFNRRIMYLAFKHSQDLLDLKTQINSHYPEWVRPEAKEFIPHVTVKRWQRYEYDHLHHNLSSLEFRDEKFEVNKISLFLSKKDEQNRKYHVIHSVDL